MNVFKFKKDSLYYQYLYIFQLRFYKSHHLHRFVKRCDWLEFLQLSNHKSLQTQWGNLSDIQKQSILAHQNEDKLGFSVDCSLMAFVFTSNFKLPNDDMVKIAREKNQGKSLLMAHRNAIRSRCKVADFDLEPSAHWGWIADVVLHTECISDDKMTKDEKIIMLNFLWDNWNELNERSIRLIEKMVETKIQHPESFKLIWEIDHIK